MISLSEAESVWDFLPLFAVMVLMPLLVVVSPAMALDQLNVYRVQQFDLHNSRYGSRQSVMNLESISVHQIKESFAKKCVIFKLNELLDQMETFQTIIDETLVAGILIILPKTMKSLNEQQLDKFLTLERFLVSREIQIPIYVTQESKQLLALYEMQSTNIVKDSEEDRQQSNLMKLYDSVMTNGYQLVVSGPQTLPLKDFLVTNVQAKLIGAGSEEQMPTIALVAHYDAFSIAPSLSFGSDSNGSGVVALLEMLRLFSKLYSNPKTQPKVNLLFVLTGAGKFNYLGTKNWIEEQLDGSDTTLLTESLFSICLDSLVNRDDTNGLYMHVSKPPKDGTPAAQLFEDLKQIASNSFTNPFNVSMIHKKINLAEETLAWEHERFSIRRLPAFTLSALNSHRSLRRKSLTDVFDDKQLDPLYSNINLISEVIAHQMYKGFDTNLFDSDLRLSKTFVKSLLYQLTRQSRSQQLLLSTRKASQVDVSPVVRSLEQIMRRFCNDVQLIHIKVDNKDNELVFYEPTQAVLNIYNVKPAIFDLIVSVVIAIYLLAFFVVLTNFHHLSSLTKKIVNSNGYHSKI
ncbi:BOS complex subunit ncln-like [Oppia nitens]|uniref:BOS complex subunit ncln-like n=1 Tax=Oppia nitens TaxID=1686743 RepID=UPI0023DC9B1D|nr:BOS complex subunit ncln-like [Oppia nitens]